MNEESLFHRALELSPAERAAFLDAACANDAALRQRLEQLLHAHTQPGSFLQERAVTLPAEKTPSAQQSTEAAGTRIGVYKLIEPIGEGGMGSVWMAEQQEPVRRLVALKLIKEGLDSARVIARFEAERQALALMDHPNIAKVFDAGTTASGRPYFVMELVKGVAITRYCDEQRLTPRQRLELFIPVCQAVQHAHQKGIIHRDLKPSNVLVTLYDGAPVPKVIDFGIAKATGDPLTERTLNTGFGAIVGTLEYMSPEQAEPNQLDIDTRSDVYSLGVLLYELLTGSTPLDRKRLQDAAIWELLRVIREEEPPRPSTRLSSAESLTALSAQRQMEPVKLARLMRGELDWIVMKALEKDRQRRYDTANALADDLNRYLRDEPVQAGPPSAAYRLRKLIKRHRSAVVATTVVLLVLLGGSIGTTIGLLRALEAEASALAARDDADGYKRNAEKARDDAVVARDDALAARQLIEQKEKETSYAKLRAETARHALQMEAVWRAWDSNDLIKATDILAQVPEPFQTTWECRHLQSVCQRKAIRLGTDSHFYWPGIFSPDGKYFVASNLRNLEYYGENKPEAATVKIWDVATGAEIGMIAEQGRPALFTRDGRRLFLIDRETVKLVEIATRKVTATFPCSGGVHFVDETRLVAQDQDTMKVWDVATGNVLHAYRSRWGREQNAAALTTASSDGQRLAFFAGNSLETTGVVVCDTFTGKELFTVPVSRRSFHSNSMQTYAFSPDSKRIVIGSDRSVKVFDATTGQEQFTLSAAPPDAGRSPYIFEVAYSPDGKSLLTFWPAVLKTWHASTGKEKLHLALKLDTMLLGGRFTPDSKSIVGYGGKRFDAETGAEQPFPPLSGHRFRGALEPHGENYIFSADGQQVAIHVTGRTIIWRRAFHEVAQELVRLQLLKGRSSGVSFSPNDTQIYHWVFQGKTIDWILQRWDRATGQALPTMERYFGGLWPRLLIGDGAHVLCSHEEGIQPKFMGWKIYHCESLQEQVAVPVDVGKYVGFTPDGKLLATRKSWVEPWRIWEVGTGRERYTLHARSEPFVLGGFAMSADSQRIASCNANNGVSIYAAQTGSEVARIPEVGSAQLAFLPDGQRLLAYRKLAVKVWDVQTGKLLQSFGDVRPSQLFSGPFTQSYMVLSPDGTRLLSGNQLYDVATGQHVLTLRPGPNFFPFSFSRDGQYLLASEDEKMIVLHAP